MEWELQVSKRANHLVQAHVPCQYSAAEIRCLKQPYHPIHKNDGYLDLSIAENKIMWDVLSEKLEHIQLTPQDLLYAEYWHGKQTVRDVVANFLNTFLHYETHSENIILGSGSSSLMEILFHTICDEGDVVVVLGPYYAGFSKLLNYRNLIELQAVYSSQDDFYFTKEGNIGFGDYLKGLEQKKNELDAQNKKIKALLFSNPTNPTGRVATKEELKQLIEWCKENQIHVVADEVYALSVHNPQVKFISANEIAKELQCESIVHTLYSLSKDFGCSGLRMALLNTCNESLQIALQKLVRFCSVSTASQLIALQLLKDHDWVEKYVKLLQQRLHHSKTLVATQLQQIQIPFVYSDAGLFVWMYLGDLFTLMQTQEKYSKKKPQDTQEDLFYKFILNEYKMNISPGGISNSRAEGWFRICCASSDENLNEFCKRLQYMKQASI